MTSSADVACSHDAAWLSLKCRIERRVILEQSTIRLGGSELAWYRVANPDSLLVTAVSDEARPAEELDPFWAATWRAALGLDQFLKQLDLRHQRVLELGCGSGQAGLGAAIRGAQVTLTDAVGLALMVARLNAWPQRSQVSVRRLKWDSEQLSVAPFPIILGSDLVYDPALFPLLEKCARQHLAPDGKLYISEPHRHTGDRFAEWIRQANWTTIEHDMDLNDGRVPIRVFECRPR
jgi:predicted nicotinamide N-methyase